MLRRAGALLAAVVLGGACSPAGGETLPPPPATSAPLAAAPATTRGPVATSQPDRTTTSATTPPAVTVAPQRKAEPDATVATTSPVTTISPYARPDWLGTRVLPRRADDHGEVQPTPPELEDRRLETVDLLPPPAGDDYEWTIGPIPAEVVARSSWSEDCPVARDDLAYLTMSHLGFDGEFHTGEMIVHAAVADDVVEVFRRLHEARYPIEQMRVIRADEIDAPPTGDGNETTGFVCRPAVGSVNWSQHALGLAIDINPFHNPYHKGDLVLPELASAYLDRTLVRPGMVFDGDVVTEAFAAIGWGWGGRWASLRDWMHFSRSGS